MAVKMKRSAVAGKVPTTAQLELGELAVNTYDGRLFLKRDDGTEAIVEIVNSGRLISAGTGLTGGGSLAADRTLAADIASQAEAEAGTASSKLMTPERVAQAIAALGGASEELSAGDTIRSRVDAYAQNTNHYSGYATRHSFDFAQSGTIRVTFDRAASHSSPQALFRVTRLRGGVETVLGSWTKGGTAWTATTLDIDVVPADRVKVQYSAVRSCSGWGKESVCYTSYARIQNVRFQTGGENLIPGVYAPVEND
ncbi:hypothetical protein MED193_12633 [Roseobacter sp. MED193]|uniref:hypothetical protein n=1 Tax=Roseobacter sp. MED193 TaxID=314262 RepID=UPI000068E3EF|nr:hypothetical protein [Roseobacter sp. MED193]EAQ43716.1 hypothetical protein MED193_12633 [Roseobacter sp. MED193]